MAAAEGSLEQHPDQKQQGNATNESLSVTGKQGPRSPRIVIIVVVGDAPLYVEQAKAIISTWADSHTWFVTKAKLPTPKLTRMLIAAVGQLSL